MTAFQLIGPNRTWLPTQHRPDRAEVRRHGEDRAQLRAEATAAIAAIDQAVARSRGGSTCGYCRAPIATTALGCRNCRRNYVTGARDYGIEHRAAGQRCGMCGGHPPDCCMPMFLASHRSAGPLGIEIR